MKQHPKEMRIMKQHDVTYDASTVTLMGRVCDDAWREMTDAGVSASQEQAEEIRRQMARNVLGAVAAGENDPDRLKSIALSAIAI